MKLWEIEHPLFIHTILSDLPLLFSHCFLNLWVCWLENINSVEGPSGLFVGKKRWLIVDWIYHRKRHMIVISCHKRGSSFANDEPCRTKSWSNSVATFTRTPRALGVLAATHAQPLLSHHMCQPHNHVSFLSWHKLSRIKMVGVPFGDVPVGCQALCRYIHTCTIWSSHNLLIVSINPVLQIREGGSRRLNAAVRERSGIFLILQSQCLS